MAIVKVLNKDASRYSIGKIILLPSTITEFDTSIMKGNHARTLLRMEGFGIIEFSQGRTEVKEVYKRYMRFAYGLAVV
jgi:hypothetical protein